MAHARKTTHSRKTAARKSTRRAAPKRWSQRVTKESDALDLKQGVFKLTSAKKIAASLKRSAEHSARRKTGAYRSALSMLTFYINRAGQDAAADAAHAAGAGKGGAEAGLREGVSARSSWTSAAPIQDLLPQGAVGR
ncbi:hypothetical protein ACVWXL_007141 [Bradyrhizobium sp. GM22.5]